MERGPQDLQCQAIDPTPPQALGPQALASGRCAGYGSGNTGSTFFREHDPRLGAVDQVSLHRAPGVPVEAPAPVPTLAG